MSRTTEKHDADLLRSQVREGYKHIAEQGKLTVAGGCNGPPSEAGAGCCGALSASQLAERIGYSTEQIASLPDGANMGLSCGNPTAIAELQAGQVALDLGSGGGFDVFLAGPKVGATGRVIGVDMTAEMLSKARANIVSYKKSTGLDNVEFRLGEIEHLPVGDHSIDVVISNCVINLSPDKPQVWREIARVLRPGGRVAVSDMALLRPLPDGIGGMIEAVVGCIAGAMLIEDYVRAVEAAGLGDVQVLSKPQYVAALSEHTNPLHRSINEHLPSGTSLADFITSIDVTARKPAAKCCSA